MYHFPKRPRPGDADALDKPRQVPVIVGNLPEFDAAIDGAARPIAAA